VLDPVRCKAPHRSVTRDVNRPGELGDSNKPGEGQAGSGCTVTAASGLWCSTIAAISWVRLNPPS